MSLTQFGNPASDAEPFAHRARKETLLQRLANLVNPYRPYKHYMRGPGPKCREKEASKKGRGEERPRWRVRPPACRRLVTRERYDTLPDVFIDGRAAGRCGRLRNRSAGSITRYTRRASGAALSPLSENG